MHENPIFLLLAGAFTVALAGGLLAKRLGLSPLVGYLLAGVGLSFFIGESSEAASMASQLAEVGVVLLMFGVGLHFHLKDLIAVRTVALTGALGQSAAATAVTMVIALSLGMSWEHGLLLGIAVSVASTVVLARALTDRGVMDTPGGHAAIGWLVVEDILTILVLVLLPPLAGASHGDVNLWETLGWSLAKLALLVALVFIAGARFIPWLLIRVARLRSRELFLLTVLAIAMAVAAVSATVFGASLALGAFLAGMVVGQSKVSHQAAADALPLRDAFAVLFFVSVGLLFDLDVLLRQPWLFAGLVAVILVAKPLVSILLVLLTRRPLRTALLVAGGLAQIGEFSFILASEAYHLGLLGAEARNLLVAAAIVTIALNPGMVSMWMTLEGPLGRIKWLSRWLDGPRRRSAADANESLVSDTRPRAMVVGYGPVGRAVVARLQEEGWAPSVIEMNFETVQELQASGVPAWYGDASGPELLHHAGLDKASWVVLTLPDAAANLNILKNLRDAGSSATVLARARYRRDREALEIAGADLVCVEEDEAAESLANALLNKLGQSATQST